MTYISGTITNSNPAAEMYAAIATALTSAGFTLHDTVVISTRTHKIWKSPAAGNIANKDWYLNVIYTTVGTGDVMFQVMEDFNAGTDLAKRVAQVPSVYYNNFTLDATYNAVNGDTGYALENAAIIPNGSGGAGGDMTGVVLPATAFGYWISITTDRIIGLFSPNPTRVLYAGLYTPSPQVLAGPAADKVYPLISVDLEGGAGRALLARWPGLTGSQSVYYMNNVYPLFPVRAMAESIPSGSTASGPKFSSPLMVASDANATRKAWWGSLIDCEVVNVDPTVSRGDTVAMAVGGATYIMASAYSNLGTIFKAV